jgi:hypothetical protein
MIDRSQCPARWHGTNSAYSNGGCRCPDAREAHRLYLKRQREGRLIPALVDGTGVARRLQGLMWLGWPRHMLAAELGVSERRVANMACRACPTVTRQTHDRISALFAQLLLTPGPSVLARGKARQHGYCSPFAWDDIDDPSAKPQGVRPVSNRRRSYAETAEEYSHFKSLGMSDHAIARALGLRPDSLSQALLRARRAA